MTIRYLVILGAIVNLFGTFIYIRDTLRGQTKPNLVSWVLWMAAPMIASAAAFSAGIRWAVLPTFMAGFVPVLVIIAALVKHKAIWRPTRFDYICGGLSIMALVLWIITKEPNLAIIFSILSDGLAALPTVRKSWLFPHTESGITYLTGLFNMLTTIAALQFFTFSELAFPIYNLIINSAICLAIYRRRIFGSDIR